jgi:hypothetical protein
VSAGTVVPDGKANRVDAEVAGGRPFGEVEPDPAGAGAADESVGVRVVDVVVRAPGVFRGVDPGDAEFAREEIDGRFDVEDRRDGFVVGVKVDAEEPVRFAPDDAVVVGDESPRVGRRDDVRGAFGGAAFVRVGG